VDGERAGRNDLSDLQTELSPTNRAAFEKFVVKFFAPKPLMFQPQHTTGKQVKP
jgi:hypothetical protein